MLTPRQREVLALVAKGHKLKTVAAELGLSTGRVDQHVAAIKQRLGVNDLIGIGLDQSVTQPLRISTGSIPPVPDGSIRRHSGLGTDPEPILLSDAMSLRRSAPWEQAGYQVGPGALDGPGAGVKRGAAIAVVAVCLVVLLLLLVAGYMLVSQAAAPSP